MTYKAPNQDKQQNGGVPDMNDDKAQDNADQSDVHDARSGFTEVMKRCKNHFDVLKQHVGVRYKQDPLHTTTLVLCASVLGVTLVRQLWDMVRGG